MSASNTAFLPAQNSLRDLARQALAHVRALRTLQAERARVRFELDQYSDRELADMGLSRGDIDGVVASIRSNGFHAA